MSECVVRMEMPDKCVNCLAWCICDTLHKYMLGIDCDSDWTYDDLLVITDETGFIKPDDCPIICQLPDGHGRLVDGDKLKSASTDGRKWCDPCPVWGEIYRAETIVPAEAERSET